MRTNRKRIAATILTGIVAIGGSVALAGPASAATCSYTGTSYDSGGVATVFTKIGCIESRSNGKYTYVGGDTWTGYGAWSSYLVNATTIRSKSQASIGGVNLLGSQTNVEYSSTAAPTSWLPYITH